MKWIAIVQLVAFAITSSANAALKTWDGGGGNLLWTNATNWNPNGVPTAADDVVIDVPAQITVTLSANSTINSLLLIDDLTVSATATLTIASPSTVAGIMNLAGGLTGTGDLNVQGTLNFTSSNLSLGGAGKIIIPKNGTMTKTGFAACQRSVDNFGTIAMTNCPWPTDGAVVITNYGQFICSLSTPQSISLNAANSGFHNYGTFTKSGVGGLSIGGGLDAALGFNNNGSVVVNAGSVQLFKGTHTGAFQLMTASATISFGPYTTMLTEQCTVSGAGKMAVQTTTNATFVCDGTIDINGNLTMLAGEGTPTFNGPVNLRGTLDLSSDNSQPPSVVIFNGMVDLLPSGIVNATGVCDVDFNGPSMDLAGVIDPSATVHFAQQPIVTRSLTWSSPVATCPNGLLATESATMDLTADITRPITMFIESHGVITTGALAFGPGGALENHGDMTFSGPTDQFTTAKVQFIGSPAPQDDVFINHGSLTRTGGPGWIRFLIPVRNTGLVDVPANSLAFESSFVNEGDVMTAPGTKLEISGESTHSPESSLDIGGELLFESSGPAHDLLGSVQIDGKLTVNVSTVILHRVIAPATPIRIIGGGKLDTEVDQNWQLGIEIDGGTLMGSGSVSLGGTTIFRGGMTGTGITTFEPGSIITTSISGGASVIGRQVISHGTFTLVGHFNFNQGTLTNNHLLIINTESPLFINGAAGANALVNNATIEKNGAGMIKLANAGANLPLVNQGIVNINQGTVQLDCGSSGEGTIAIDAGATLRANSNCAGGSMQVDGTLWMSPNKHFDLSGTYTQSTTGKLKATMLALGPPVITAAGHASLNGTIETLMTPMPTSPTLVPLVATSSNTITGAFTATLLQPHGVVQYTDNAATWQTYMPGDCNGDSAVDIDDLLIVINSWGVCQTPIANCLADQDANGVVDVDDLIAVINYWS